jgi:transcriptional regulator with XRE-family HTH domain
LVTKPVSRDRIIGARLRAIRNERTTLSLEQAAAEAQWSPSRLSRTERGLRQVTLEEVAVLLTAYRLPVSAREEILAEMRAGSSSGWWDRALPGVPPDVGALASYESDADGLVDVSTALVPGLLQIYETAVGVMLADGVPRRDIETRWMARLRRQQILGIVSYTAFIPQDVLRIPYGGERARKAQLEHLLRAQDRGISVRIIPDHQTEVLMLHSWLWMRFPNTGPVVHVELSSGAFFLHDEDVRPYTVALDRLNKIALPQTASRVLISELMEA